MKALSDEIDNVSPPLTCTCDKCTCGLATRVNKEKEDHRLLHFLMKVNEQYAQVRSTILMLTELPNPTLAYCTLLQEQTHKELSHPNLVLTDGVAFFSDKKRFIKNGYPNDHHRPSVSGKNLTSRRYSTFFCDYCKTNGHTKDKFFKLHNYP